MLHNCVVLHLLLGLVVLFNVPSCIYYVLYWSVYSLQSFLTSGTEFTLLNCLILCFQNHLMAIHRLKKVNLTFFLKLCYSGMKETLKDVISS